MSDGDGLERPRLRPVEAYPVEVEGERKVLLRDPAGYTEATAVVPVPVFFLLTMCDGAHTPEQMSGEFAQRFDADLPPQRVRDILQQIDQAFLFESERFRTRQRTLHDEFRIMTSRPPAHAGGAYAVDAKDLKRQLDGYWDRQGGPGGPPAPGTATRPLRAVIAPHVDFHRGGHVYAWAYREVGSAAPADLYVIFGTGHQIMQNRFALTTKDYETPLGPARTDAEMVRKLAARCRRQDVFLDEYNHRNEHSIEFQAVALKFVLGDRPFRILPILVGSFHDLVLEGTEPIDSPDVKEFVGELANLLGAERGRVCLVGGVDFAHVGKKFGDEEGIEPGFLAGVERDDRAMLEPIVAGDPAGLYESIRKDHDRRRICGFPPMYVQFAVQGKAPQGQLLQYDRTLDEKTASVVTFASVAYWGDGEPVPA